MEADEAETSWNCSLASPRHQHTFWFSQQFLPFDPNAQDVKLDSKATIEATI